MVGSSRSAVPVSSFTSGAGGGGRRTRPVVVDADVRRDDVDARALDNVARRCWRVQVYKHAVAIDDR